MRVPELESYLADLEKALAGISTSERAEIITEIKSHVTEAKEKQPEREISSILASMGDAKQVANRYLMERGISPSKPPSRMPMVTKWLVIGFLGTLGLAMAFTGLVVWKFSPIVEVNEDESHVRILGGLIDVRDDDGSVQLGGIGLSGNFSKQTIEGSKKLESKDIEVAFSNGKFTFANSSDGTFRWKCQVKSGRDKLDFFPTKARFDLSNVAGAKCHIEVPRQARLKVEGANGKVALEKPHFNTELELLNGKVEIDPADGEKYRFRTQVTNGSADAFASTDGPGALDIRVAVGNGKISRP